VTALTASPAAMALARPPHGLTFAARPLAAMAIPVPVAPGRLAARAQPVPASPGTGLVAAGLTRGAGPP
jgi:hypothetical protein